MRRVFVAGLLQESNTFSPRESVRDDFFMATGKEMLEWIAAAPPLERAGYVPVPSLFAYAVPGGPLRADDFLSFQTEILDALERALGEGSIAGIWLYLHGALEVSRIGSGEASLVRSIRMLVGQSVPIAVALDFHANITSELVDTANIVYGYRTAPHVDVVETQTRTAELLVEAMESGALPHAIMVPIPMLIPGEMATTPVEPLRALMPELSRAETVPGVMCASFFDGMAWVDAPHSRASIVVVERSRPGSVAHDAQREAARLAGLFWDRRREFAFEEETATPTEAIQRAIASRRRPVFVSDSGDNFTAGAPGDSIWFLRLLLQYVLPPTLVAGITCRRAVHAVFNAASPPSTCSIELGGELDPYGERMTLPVEVLWKGRVLDKSGAYNTRGVRVRAVENPAVEVILTEDRVSFTSPAGIESADARIDDYHLIVVKLGYLFDALRRVAGRSIMAITPGAASQDMTSFSYRRLQRPVFPLDPEVEWEPPAGH